MIEFRRLEEFDMRLIASEVGILVVDIRPILVEGSDGSFQRRNVGTFGDGLSSKNALGNEAWQG